MIADIISKVKKLLPKFYFIYYVIPILYFYFGVKIMGTNDAIQQNSSGYISLVFLYLCMLPILIFIIYTNIENIIFILKNTTKFNKVCYLQISLSILTNFINIIIVFAWVFTAIYLFDNNSFSNINAVTPFTAFFDMVYFSAITFSTLGYGDIAPLTIASKVAVIIEVLIFVVFISVIVLNILITNKTETKEDSPNA